MEEMKTWGQFVNVSSTTGSLGIRRKFESRVPNPQTATFRRRGDARAWVEQVESEIRLGRYAAVELARKYLLHEAIERYLIEIMPRKKESTQESQILLLNWWSRRIGEHSLSSVTPALVTDCRNALLEEPGRHGVQRGPAIVNRYLATLSHVFTVAVREWQWASENPCRYLKKLSEPRGRERYLSDDEVVRLLDACRLSYMPALFPVVVLALATGMRKGEILRLQWDRVDLEAGSIRLIDTKNGHARTVPLTGFALDVVKQWQAESEIGSLVFPCADDLIRPIEIRRAWNRSMRDAGVENFHFHDLRHTCASYLVGNGISLAALAEILGHRTLQMVRRYSHLADDRARDELMQVGERMFRKFI